MQPKKEKKVEKDHIGSNNFESKYIYDCEYFIITLL
jgi:hypothetical protein